MSYQPLARKYRPRTFQDLVGQEMSALALTNAIRLGREPHGVIFSGVRGIGKTTLARLYAKALNCVNGPTPEPCDVCENCLAINRGVHEDVLEIDGASNTGVDDVRQLRDTLAYVPLRSKYKVYIIDEVHMLSQSAFNALLKSIEEPPPSVVFVFATTELNKIPETITSRCLTFHLKKIPNYIISERIKYILQKEKIDFEPDVANLVAREGQGSLRDALTFLDQAVVLAGGQLTIKKLREVFPQLSSLNHIELLKQIMNKDASSIVPIIATMDQAGGDFISIVEETAKFARHAFMLKDLGKDMVNVALLGLCEEELGMLSQIGESTADFDLNRAFRWLVQCRKDMDGSALDRFIFENYALEWCLDPGLPELDDLLKGSCKPISRKVTQGVDSARTIEDQKKALSSLREMTKAEEVNVSNVSEVHTEPGAIKPKKFTFPSDWRTLVDLWKEEKPLLARQLEEVYNVAYSPEKIVLLVSEDSLSGRSLLKKEQQQKIGQQFEEMFGFKGCLQILPKSEEQSSKTILETKAEESAIKKADLLNIVQNNALTKNVLATFNGVIEDIEILSGDGQSSKE